MHFKLNICKTKQLSVINKRQHFKIVRDVVLRFTVTVT